MIISSRESYTFLEANFQDVFLDSIEEEGFGDGPEGTIQPLGPARGTRCGPGFRQPLPEHISLARRIDEDVAKSVDFPYTLDFDFLMPAVVTGDGIGLYGACSS